MHCIEGYLTADAVLRETDNGRQWISFKLATKEHFTLDNTREHKVITTYFDCTYWLSPHLHPFLRKGAWVEIAGKLGAHAWIDKDGKPRGEITVNCRYIDIRKQAKRATTKKIN